MYVPILYKVKMELLNTWAVVLLDIKGSQIKSTEKKLHCPLGGCWLVGSYRPQTLHAMVNDLGQCSRT